MLYGETTLWVFASAPCIFSRKILILSSQKRVAAERALLLSGSRRGAVLVVFSVFLVLVEVKYRFGSHFSCRRLRSATPVAVRPMAKIIKNAGKNIKFGQSSASALFFATPIALSRPRRLHFFFFFFLICKNNENST